MKPAPDVAWNDAAEPRFGTWRGELQSLDFSDHSNLERIRREKRWLWCSGFTDAVAWGLAIVRTGYAGNVFFWAFDRASGEFLEDVSRILPPPAVSVADWPSDGTVAKFRGLFEGIEVTREGEAWNVSGTIADCRLDMTIEESADPITAICPVVDASHDGNRPLMNATRKQVGAQVRGDLRIGERHEAIAGVALLDYSHGMLARETVWRWAIASGRMEDGREVGFNLVADFNGSLENVVWVDGEPRSAGRANFEESDEAWTVEAEGVSAALHCEAVRSQTLDLGLVVSDYRQPLGTWSGTVDGVAFRGVGVAEFHRSVW